MTPLDEFLAALARSIDAGGFASLVLSKKLAGAADLQDVRVRPIMLRGEPALSFVHRHATRDVTKNFARAEALAAIAGLLDPAAETRFGHATLHASDDSLQLRASRKGRQALVRMPQGAALARTVGADGDSEGEADVSRLSHDRVKPRALSLDLPFLVDLGIADERHRLVPSMARKWKQIDKFIEVIAHALDAAGVADGTALRVVDFGCGKGYLTFAVHEYLRQRYGGAPQVTGVELRADLVALCKRAAARSGCAGLRFVQGDLRSYRPEAVDLMIALHACDTATDHALDLGLRAGARILIASPCCHKELRPQMTSPRPLAPLFRHGIHLGQEAEMVTDGLRALFLESCGYSAQVFEFVSLEHTGKNKMILATRRPADAGVAARRALAEADAIKAFYGIREQCLERLLNERSAAQGGSAPPDPLELAS
ncbi:MAG: SAM-dependent methyltransferase [Caldimonas sp.]